MARAQKLKVYRTPAGFYDAYVAAPSQKAALAAWGSDRDLFARGIAEIVTDPALTAEALASPGVVVKQSRGTTAEQIDAMPDPPPQSRKEAGSDHDDRSVRSRKGKPTTLERPSPKPKPSSAKLEAAEHALETAKAEYAQQLKELADREVMLARERRDLEKRQRDGLAAAEGALDEERGTYDDAVRRWRTSKSGA